MNLFFCAARSDLTGNQMGISVLQQRDTVLVLEMQLFSICWGFFCAMADGGTKVKPVEQNYFQHIYPV